MAPPPWKESHQPTAVDSRGPAQHKLKVCHVIATADGARWVAEQLRELRDRHGCEVLAVVGGGQGGLVEMLRAEGIPYHVENFNFTLRSAIFRAPLTIFGLARLFRRERVDVVQSHLFFSMVVTRFAAWLADVPVRLAMYASPFHLEAAASRFIDRATWWMESMLIPSCEMSVDLCLAMGAGRDRLALIYYGPDERRFDPQKVGRAGIRAAYGWPESTPVIAKVAYFYPRLAKSRWVPAVVQGRGHKGHEDVVRAAPHVLREYPDAKFLLIGSGWGSEGERYKSEVEGLVREMGLERSVVFPGYRADANSVLREADVAVQASLHDNPAGTIEALLMECPTVVTRVGGLVDTVRDGETGLQANPSDPQDLARAITQLLRDREGARAFGRAGRKLMLERFTLTRTVEDLRDVYLGLRRGAGRRHFHPLRSLWRAALAVPLMAYLAAGLMLIKLRPPARPRLAHVRRLLRRAYQARAFTPFRFD